MKALAKRKGRKRGRKKGRAIFVTKTFRFSPEHSKRLVKYAARLSATRGKRISENGAIRELIDTIPR